MSTTPSCSPPSSPRKRKLSDAGLDTEIPKEIIAEIDNESRIEADKVVKQNPAFEALRQRVTDTFDLLQPELTSIQN